MIKKIVFFAYFLTIIVQAYCMEEKKHTTIGVRAFNSEEINSISEISIDNSHGDIILKSHDDKYIQLTMLKKGPISTLDLITTKVKFENNTLKISSNCLKPLDAVIKYKLLIPRNKQLLYTLTAIAGKILVSDIHGTIDATTISESNSIIRVNGNIKAKSNSGPIIINHVTGNVDAETISGYTHIKNITAAPSNLNKVTILHAFKGVLAKSITGNMNLTNIQDYAHCQSINGNMKIILSQLSKQFIGTSVDGNIQVVMDHNDIINSKKDNCIKITTMSSDITLSTSQLLPTPLYAKTYRGKIQNSSSARIDNKTCLHTISLETMSGNIVLLDNKKD